MAAYYRGGSYHPSGGSHRPHSSFFVTDFHWPPLGMAIGTVWPLTTAIARTIPPGPSLGSVFLWRCFCRQKPPCIETHGSQNAPPKSPQNIPKPPQNTPWGALMWFWKCFGGFREGLGVFWVCFGIPDIYPDLGQRWVSVISGSRVYLGVAPSPCSW